MKVVVYLGPSLALDRARTILPDADFRPPIKSRELTAAVLERPTALVIIDGLFEQVASVRHKEILFALSEGIPVYGASSMGALRAAETAAFGTIGVGRIYEAFASGEWTDDDEVTVSHASEELGFRPLSDAMATIRFGLAAARERGIVDASQAETLVRIAKDTYYAERSWAELHARALAAGLAPDALSALQRFVREQAPDQKRDDAIEALERVRSDLARDEGPRRFDFDFEATEYFQQLWLDHAKREALLDRRTAAGVTARRLAHYVRAWGAADASEVRAAGLLAFAAQQRLTQGDVHDDDEEQRVAEKLQLFGITDPDLIWQVAAGGFAAGEVVRGADVAIADANIALSVAHDPRIETHHDALGERQQALAHAGLSDAPIERTGQTLPALVAWYVERRGGDAGSLEELAAHLGVQADALLRELIDQYLFETACTGDRSG